MSRADSYQTACREVQRVPPDSRRAVMRNLGLQYDARADTRGLDFVEELENHPTTLLSADHVRPTVAELKKVQTTGRAVNALEVHQRSWPDESQGPIQGGVQLSPPAIKVDGVKRRGGQQRRDVSYEERQEAYSDLVKTPLMDLADHIRDKVAVDLGWHGYRGERDAHGIDFVRRLPNSRARLSDSHVAGIIAVLQKANVKDEAGPVVELLQQYQREYIQ